MNTSVRYSPIYSVADYQRWEGYWELIDGVAVDMGPSPFGPHGAMAARLATAFVSALDRLSAVDFCVIQEVDWILDANNVLRPDIAIIPGPVPDKYLTKTPVLIVEILSPSTADKDRTVKFELYQQRAVRHFLLADPDSRSIEWYQLVDGVYQPQPFQDCCSFQLSEGYLLGVDFSKLKLN
jgi:Uma2 family endonuclease